MDFNKKVMVATAEVFNNSIAMKTGVSMGKYGQTDGFYLGN